MINFLFKYDKLFILNANALSSGNQQEYQSDMIRKPLQNKRFPAAHFLAARFLDSCRMVA